MSNLNGLQHHHLLSDSPSHQPQSARLTARALQGRVSSLVRFSRWIMAPLRALDFPLFTLRDLERVEDCLRLRCRWLLRQCSISTCIRGSGSGNWRRRWIKVRLQSIPICSTDNRNIDTRHHGAVIVFDAVGFGAKFSV